MRVALRSVPSALALGLLLGLPVAAQQRAAFPAVAIDAPAPFPARVLAPQAAAIDALHGVQQLVLEGLALPGGAVVDLQLSAIDLARLKFGYQVNGRPAPGLADGLSLSVFRGSVVGAPGSEALLSLSQRGIFGWVHTGEQLVHLLPRAGANNDWTASELLLVDERDLVAGGFALRDFCGLDRLPGLTRDGLPAPPLSPPGLSGPDGGGDCSLYECTIAIETDWQLYGKFNDLGAETAFVTTLLAAVSSRYEEQIDTILTFPYVQFYTTSNDPWSTPEGGGSMIDMLNEFVPAWSGAIPADATLGHFISGAGLGGGVAYLGVLCDDTQTASFAVSGNIDGDVPFPIAVGPLNWDFIVVAHETGHNFNSTHTHSYVPPLDTCPSGNCITNGTIMSYCHQCPGGTSNITTYFQEPVVTGVMKAHAAACLPLLAPLVADALAQPTLIAPGAAPTVAVTLLGTPVGGVTLNARLSPLAPFTPIAMADQGGGTWSASLPAVGCGDDPEWFFSVVDLECGPFSTPAFTAEVGVETVLAFDDMEAASGWTVGSPQDDATTGIWTRGDPLGTGAQPENDFSPAGTDCWFTGQGSPGGSVGENDVDDGRTTLTSPALDLSSGDARISYWRWYNNTGGSSPNADIFEVEVSANGTTWVNVETVGPAGADTAGGWSQHEFTVSDFVVPGPTVFVRFIASDEGSGSIVEAAVDDLKVSRVDCGTVCQADLGFGGPGGATLSLCGGDLSTGTSGELLLAGAKPNSTAFLFAGLTFAPMPVKGGVLVPLPPQLLIAQPLGPSGSISTLVPGGNGPLSVYVQYAYLDAGQVAGYGFSNALRVDFLP